MTHWQRLKVTENDGIVTVSLNRPEKLNALDVLMFQELDKVSRSLRQRKDIRAVILTGEGGNFSSGLDVQSVATSPAKVLGILKKWLPGNANLAQRVSRNWRKIPVPVIAVIEGRCLGGGMQIVLGADFRLATPDAELSIMEVRWGLVPDMAGLLSLRELVAKDVAMKLTMTGEIIAGTQAKHMGLVTEIHEAPLAVAEAFARQITQASPDAIAAIKSTTNQCWTRSERYLLARETLSQIRLILGKNFQIAGHRQRNKSDKAYQNRQSFW
ncbi:crotonase/enoyl-CoA hydratase family protein (plasmid) [Photobacterium sp. GJ3]|uniref:crotonase/enoyl-CoA hydratase family protein n=1 Tax=Photobacterium sp. GJ3 TaxID=2829502 RepID=UPI001B8B1054|nr:crotonase/enoyl-CoA hydratase family protein [Photobacterium sp. GJ3]QUJ70083.1 crotonase/enoyl-CoA hydratase family protein [Photobacterium sp. GJ3]